MRIVLLGGWERIGISVLSLGAAGLCCVIAIRLLRQLLLGAWDDDEEVRGGIQALVALCIAATIGLGVLGIAQLFYGINNLVDPTYAVIHLLMREV